MRISAAIAMSLLAAACVADEAADEEFGFEQSVPEPMSGKSDEPRACGEESCLPELCGYDLSKQGVQATESCAAEDGRASTFVSATIGGSETGSFDSRTNPYVPRLQLDNVLVYGCELWDFSGDAYDGLEIEYQELIHSSFTVNANDPTRTKKDFKLYIKGVEGPGSYRAQAMYRAANDAALYAGNDACSVDVTVDDSGTVSGAYECTIPARMSSASVGVTGTFACGKNAMNPIFSVWAAAPI